MIHSKEVYTEVYEVLKGLDKQMVMRIPEQILQTIIDSVDEDYKVTIDWNMPLEKQNLKEETLNVLGWLNLNFWAEGEEKIAYQQQYLKNIIEQENSQQLTKTSFWQSFLSKMKK